MYKHEIERTVKQRKINKKKDIRESREESERKVKQRKYKKYIRKSREDTERKNKTNDKKTYERVEKRSREREKHIRESRKETTRKIKQTKYKKKHTYERVEKRSRERKNNNPHAMRTNHFTAWHIQAISGRRRMGREGAPGRGQHTMDEQESGRARGQRCEGDNEENENAMRRAGT